MSLAGQHALVLGLGESGHSMARWLARHGARVRVADTRAVPPARAALATAVPAAQVVTGPFTDALLDGVDLVAVSPGLPLDQPVVAAARARGLDVVGDVELFARFLAAAPAARPSRVIAITGTNGKTTVTALTGAMCRASGLDVEVAGNISPAVLDAAAARLDAGEMPDVWVLELSSFQLESTSSLRPAAAAMLNLSADHLDRHATMQGYAAAKARIFAGEGVQILNRDDPWSLSMRIAGRPCITFGLGPALDPEDFGLLKVFGEHWLAKGATPLVAAHELKLAGLHNAANALAALAACKAIGLRCAPLLDALRGFEGLPHRVQRVAEIGGVRFYDDSKGTNVGATVAALDGFARQLASSGAGGPRVVLIAGGDGKGQDFAPLREPVAAAARAVVVIGRDGPLVETAIQGSGVQVVRAATMADAVARARAAARPGDVVLLSPACASFDMFANYKQRGEAFRAAVTEAGRAHAA